MFYKQIDDLSKNETPWYEKSNHPESWAKTPLKSGMWILTPVSVPEDTTSSNYQKQQALIGTMNTFEAARLS